MGPAGKDGQRGHCGNEDRGGVGLGVWRSRQGMVGNQIPSRGAGLDAVSSKGPVRILGPGVGITKYHCLVRMF